MSTQEFSAYSTGQDQIWAQLQSRLVIARREFGKELAEILQLERLEKLNVSTKKRELRYFRIAIGIPLLALLYLIVTIPMRYDHNPLFTLHLTTVTSVIWVEIGIFLFGLLALGVSSQVVEALPASRTASRLEDEYRRATQRYKP